MNDGLRWLIRLSAPGNFPQLQPVVKKIERLQKQNKKLRAELKKLKGDSNG